MSKLTPAEIKERIATRFALLGRARQAADVTDTEYRHFDALLSEFHSIESGRCNPTDAMLGAAAGGKCARTAGTATRSLQAKGYLTKTPTRGASNYTFPALEGRQPSADLEPGRSATSCNKVGNIVSEGRQPACRAEPISQPITQPIGAYAPTKRQSGKRRSRFAEILDEIVERAERHDAEQGEP